MNQTITAAVLIFFFSTSLVAAEANTPPPKADDIRCEKLVGTTLVDFKASLVENCNLNKPFSSSLSKALSDEVYFYCCHKR